MTSEKSEEFEQLLEKHGAFEATKRFYKNNARDIVVGIVSISILFGLALSDLPVGTRAMIVLILGIISLLYGKFRNGSD
jgi:hypothetical protein